MYVYMCICECVNLCVCMCICECANICMCEWFLKTRCDEFKEAFVITPYGLKWESGGRQRNEGERKVGRGGLGE